jgi:ribosomal protein S18 acetylase RimI-like enzyme
MRAREANNPIFVEVHERNQPAHRLYRSCGFQLDGRRKNYYGPQEDALTYSMH